MINFLIDTNILLLFLREDKRWNFIENRFAIESATTFISVITVGEIESIALRNHRGEKTI